MGRPVRSTKGPVQFIAVTSSSSVMGYFTVAVVLLAFLPGGLACAPQPSGITVDRLMRMLDAAKARNGSGRMHLQGHGSGPTSAGYPIAEWPPGTEVVRAPEGGTLVIPFPYHITNNITLRVGTWAGTWCQLRVHARKFTLWRTPSHIFVSVYGILYQKMCVHWCENRLCAQHPVRELWLLENSKKFKCIQVYQKSHYGPLSLKFCT
ncbi:uncharacterized protein LOC129601264 isoform X3 [Paramacrobiotus metropolitanus]|uniref:uncharacterized protein LOC129601264 isoform X3 n=1 Tax=Paramacrobiotus metropolitanus TaxID=2943436 RepID=UPI002445FF3C|nr:uncharacterized protein LOC129601264 isoform X3 [Paramacrobiotus metropolitanus]